MVRRGKRRRWRRATEGIQSQIGVRLAPCTWLPSHTSSKAVPDLTAAISAHASRDSLNTPPAAASSKVSFPRASTEAMSTNRSCSLKEYRQMMHLSRPFHHQLGLRLHVAASPAADSAIVTGSLLAKVKIFPRRPLNVSFCSLSARSPFLLCCRGVASQPFSALIKISFHDPRSGIRIFESTTKKRPTP